MTGLMSRSAGCSKQLLHVGPSPSRSLERICGSSSRDPLPKRRKGSSVQPPSQWVGDNTDPRRLVGGGRHPTWREFPGGGGRSRVHLARLTALSAFAFTLTVAAPGAFAQEPPSTPSATPEPSPEPSPDPSPSPSPDPTSEPPPTSSPTPDPAPTSPPRNPPPPADDPTTSGGGPGQTDTPPSTDGVPLSPFEAALSLLG